MSAEEFVLQTDVNAVIRDLMDVAKVAVGPEMPQVSKAQAVALLTALMAPVATTMPEELQAQDTRVSVAKAVLRFLVD